MKKIIFFSLLPIVILIGGCTYSLQQNCFSDDTKQSAETPKTVTPSTNVSVPASVVP